jgi:mono/diheme cytochrome c family protein
MQEATASTEPVAEAAPIEAAHAAEDVSFSASEAEGAQAHSVAAEETGHDEPQDIAFSETAVQGGDLFNAVGCAACHGPDAGGTEIAPALSGQTEAQVRRQARAPVGIMPVFPMDKITDTQLDSLVDYVTSLSGGNAHQKSSNVGAEMEMHHWMALSAIEVNDINEAIHHVEHVIGLTEGDHRARMQAAIIDLEAGNLHDSAHHIKEMLAGVLADDLTGDTMHLKLALSSLRTGDPDGAVHHTEHFIAVAAGAGLEDGRTILGLMQSGDLEAAENHLEGLFGASGAAMDMDMEGAGHDEAEEGHDDGTEAHDEAEEGHDDGTEAHDEAEEGHDDGMAGMP